MNRVAKTGLAVAALVVSPIIYAQPLKVDRIHIDRVQNPASVIKIVDDFRTSKAGRALIATGSALAGADPSQVLLANDSIPRIEKKEKEETHSTIWAPSGYQFCRARISVESMAPGSGSPRAHLAIGLHQRGVNTYTVTPELSDGRRGWVEFYVDLVSVRADLADSYRANGKCASVPADPAAATVVLSCSGNPCSGGDY